MSAVALQVGRSMVIKSPGMSSVSSQWRRFSAKPYVSLPVKSSIVFEQAPRVRRVGGLEPVVLAGQMAEHFLEQLKSSAQIQVGQSVEGASNAS